MILRLNLLKKNIYLNVLTTKRSIKKDEGTVVVVDDNYSQWAENHFPYLMQNG